MNTIGLDCEDIIMGYKQDLDNFEEHRNNFRPVIETINDYKLFITELVRINYRFLRLDCLETKNCYLCDKIILTQYSEKCDNCNGWRTFLPWCE